LLVLLKRLLIIWKGEKMKKTFKPIILGTDKNAYSMAKSFYEEYRIKSLAIGKKRLYPTKFSRIVDVLTFDDFDVNKVFINELLKLGEQLKDEYEKLVLISCGDNYTELIVQNKKELKKYFVVPYLDEKLQKQLENKDKFYEICEKYKLDYPKTYICDSSDDNLNFDFEFPVVVKAANSIEYLKLSFVGKQKAYFVDNINEVKKIIENIYQAGYTDKVIIQEYIPGDDTAGFVLNTYSNQNGRVKMMCLGDVVLEHYGPYEIGNYAAIIASYNLGLYQKYQKFLEDIGYIGFAHFDLKYDVRDGKYKLFEINLRQGRSYYVTGAGNNMAKLVVDEYVYGKEQELVYSKNEWLWLDIPKKVLFKYANKNYHGKLRELIKKKKYGYTLFYRYDFSPFRLAIVLKLHQLNFKMYRNYFRCKK